MYIRSPVGQLLTRLQHSEKEKKYAHYLGLASWAGARIIQGKSLYCPPRPGSPYNLITFSGQWTPQAKELYDLLILTFSDASGRSLADLDLLQKCSGVSATEWEDLLQYTVQACQNTPMETDSWRLTLYSHLRS